MKAEFYITFKLHRKAGSYSSTPETVQATHLTQSRPITPSGDLCVKFTVDIPKEVIEPQVVVQMETVASAIDGLKKTAAELQ